MTWVDRRPADGVSHMSDPRSRSSISELVVAVHDTLP